MNNEFYEEIYNLLRDVTPLKADCGVLCDCKCCKGDDHTGMLLFPNEKTNLSVKEIDGRRLAVCNGSCNRKDRPLACMIFPFFPTVSEKGKINVKYDYRGMGICPMIENGDLIKFNRKFLKNVKKAGKLLLKDNECKKFIKEISFEINEAEELALILNRKER